jgi:hypothetical protein
MSRDPSTLPTNFGQDKTWILSSYSILKSAEYEDVFNRILKNASEVISIKILAMYQENESILFFRNVSNKSLVKNVEHFVHTMHRLLKIDHDSIIDQRCARYEDAALNELAMFWSKFQRSSSREISFEFLKYIYMKNGNHDLVVESGKHADQFVKRLVMRSIWIQSVLESIMLKNAHVTNEEIVKKILDRIIDEVIEKEKNVLKMNL